MTTLREAAQQALEAMGYVGADWICEASHHAKKDQHKLGEPCPLQQRWHVAYQALRAALAEPVQEPVAWMHNLIDDNIITHRPADIDRHPDRWTALYPDPKPCPTCEALARTVMMDQTGYDTAPPQRKPLTEEELRDTLRQCPHDTVENLRVRWLYAKDFARAIERAHGIGDSDE